MIRVAAEDEVCPYERMSVGCTELTPTAVIPAHAGISVYGQLGVREKQRFPLSRE